MKKVVGFFESLPNHVKLIESKMLLDKGENMNICTNCNQTFEKTFSKKRYFQKDIQVIVTEIPCSKCKCDESFSLDTLLKIDAGLKQNTFKRDTFVTFGELTKSIS